MEPPSCDLERRQRFRGGLVLGCVLLVFLGLAYRVAYVSTVLAPDLTRLADDQQRGHQTIPARRGLVFDSRGRIVAGSKPVYSVCGDPVLIHAALEESGQTLPDLARQLATILRMDAGFIEDRIRTHANRRFCWFKRRVPDVEADAIRDAALPGVGLRQEMSRTYPMGSRMAHVIGLVGVDGDGLEGIEQSFDAHLRGRPGRAVAFYDARRRPIAGVREGSEPPIDGGHVVLTLDAVIQEAAEDQLAHQIRQHNAESGVALVMDPRTGDILAMACWPTYDPNDPSSSSPETRRNRIITDPIEPGSTFKPFVAASALKLGVINRTEIINCGNGTMTVNGRVLTDTHPSGPCTLMDIIVHSSNIGMGQLGLRLGNERLVEIVSAFGFGRPTGIEIAGEAPGSIPSPATWSRLTSTSVPMGYEIAVTPLQLATGYCALVNGGLLLKPRLVRAVLDPGGEVIESYDKPVVVQRVLPEDIARYMQETVLVAVVKRGGTDGRRDKLDMYEYQMLGKTGTSKLAYRNRPGYESGAYLSSFVGAAPAEEPRAVALVMIRRPKGSGYYGRIVAAPAVKEILFSTLSYLGVPGRGTIQAGL
jgi:cell division protein FtsI (penicillin-binding protein 3)